MAKAGLGAIFPAMVNAYEALGLLGYPADHPLRAKERRAIEDLLVVNEHSAYCQPCVSPVWDTAWACIALQQIGDERSKSAVKKAFNWLAEKQLLEEPQDWSFNRPKVRERWLALSVQKFSLSRSGRHGSGRLCDA